MKALEIESFGMRLKLKRISIGMKQEEIAKTLGLSQKTISAWETRKAEPSIADIERLALVLGCSPSWLVGWEQE